MADYVIAGLVALVVAALLYIGGHELVGLSNEIIMDNALACAGVLAVALGGKLLHDYQRERK
jgi:hypothetical protein